MSLISGLNLFDKKIKYFESFLKREFWTVKCTGDAPRNPPLKGESIHSSHLHSGAMAETN